MLCQRANIPVKKMILDIGFTEQSVYRWFKEDNMETKNLKLIADYFQVDLVHFFDNRPGNVSDQAIKQPQVKEPLPAYSKVRDEIKDKYIKVLEENIVLQKQIVDLRCELLECQAKLSDVKTKQPV